MKLKLVGFSESDKLIFESILTIAESRLNKAWYISETMGDVDFYLLSSRLRSQFADDKLLNTLPREQCIFFSTKSTDSGDYELLVDSNNIPYLKALVVLFNRIDIECEPINGSSPRADRPESARPMSTQNNPSSVSITDNLVIETRSRGFFVKKKTAEIESQPVSDVSVPMTEATKSRGFFSKQEIVEDIALDLVKSVPAIDQSRCFEPLDNRFIQQLLTQAEKILLLSVKGGDALYIDLAGKSYYSVNTLEQLQPYFASGNEFSVQIITNSQFRYAIANEGLKPHALSGLLWYSVFTCSQGLIITGHQSVDVVRLKRWPDINLPGCKKLIKLAAYMHSNAVDLQTVQVQTGVPIEQVYDFYNACKVINLIEVCQSKEIHEKSMDEQQQALYEKIGKRINLTLGRK